MILGDMEVAELDCAEVDVEEVLEVLDEAVAALALDAEVNMEEVLYEAVVVGTTQLPPFLP